MAAAVRPLRSRDGMPVMARLRVPEAGTGWRGPGEDLRPLAVRLVGQLAHAGSLDVQLVFGRHQDERLGQRDGQALPQIDRRALRQQDVPEADLRDELGRRVGWNGVLDLDAHAGCDVDRLAPFQLLGADGALGQGDDQAFLAGIEELLGGVAHVERHHDRDRFFPELEDHPAAGVELQRRAIRRPAQRQDLAAHAALGRHPEGLGPQAQTLVIGHGGVPRGLAGQQLGEARPPPLVGDRLLHRHLAWGSWPPWAGLSLTWASCTRLPASGWPPASRRSSSSVPAGRSGTGATVPVGAPMRNAPGWAPPSAPAP